MSAPPAKPDAWERTRGAALEDARDTFRRWLGNAYDLDALHFVLALVAVERLDGDAPWGLVVSGSGNAKTETVQAAEGAGAVITSSIASEGALLSATAKRERTSDSTGGLLLRLGDSGVLCIKDVTSILSMNSDARLAVLAALREVADGYWERNVGTDGGKSLTWRGRIVVIGAVTSAWDTHHAVISSMGDRFLLLRVDSTRNAARLTSGRQSLANIGRESAMRAELRDAIAGVIAHMRPAEPLEDDDADALLRVANLVTASRTAVERDRRGDVVAAHALESPTRLVKALGQLVRGAVSVGMTADDAVGLALRVARDCVPPLRVAALQAVETNPGATTSDLARYLDRPRSSVDRALQELHLLGLLTVVTGEGETKWRYLIAPDVDLDALGLITGSATFTRKVGKANTDPLSFPMRTDFSGETRLESNETPKSDTSENASVASVLTLPGVTP